VGTHSPAWLCARLGYVPQRSCRHHGRTLTSADKVHVSGYLAEASASCCLTFAWYPCHTHGVKLQLKQQHACCFYKVFSLKSVHCCRTRTTSSMSSMFSPAYVGSLEFTTGRPARGLTVRARCPLKTAVKSQAFSGRRLQAREAHAPQDPGKPRWRSCRESRVCEPTCT
jgi:hypothetical protein